MAAVEELASGVGHELLLAGRNLQVATSGPSGPHVVTYWYGLLDGQIVGWTAAVSRTARNLGADPRYAAVIEDGGATYSELHNMRIKGRAELVTDRDQLIAIGHALLHRNFPEADIPPIPPLVDSGRRVGLIFHVDRVASWDNRGTGRTGPLP